MASKLRAKKSQARGINGLASPVGFAAAGV
jgi:hypothetical protein